MTGLRRVVVAAVALSVMASCSIREDAAPRPIPEDPTAPFGEFPTGEVASGDRSIYLLAPVGADEQQLLRSVRRNTSSSPTDVLESLLLGPNAEENEDGLTSALPDDLVVLDTRTVGTRLTIDLNDALIRLSDLGQRVALAQIVATVTGIEQVQQVRILVDGETRPWPTGDGEVTDRPLSIYDYPGYVESSQPPFAALSA
jgi:spore germination protein GerM